MKRNANQAHVNSQNPPHKHVTNVQLKPNNPNYKVNIILWNCNSLMGKRPYIAEFLKTEKPDILCLNEIKFEIRKEDSGGGVLLLVHKKWEKQFEEIGFPETLKDEIVGITLKDKNQNIDIYTIYVPPEKSYK